MRKIDTIIIHCSDSTFGDAAEINRWHLARGWSMIGYHYVILNGVRKRVFSSADDGRIEVGRPEFRIGAHCEGHNANSIGICLIGVDKFTAAQFGALRRLVADLKSRYQIKLVAGHNHFTTAKSCPNFKVEEVLHGA